jgi:hypothetical protein
MVMRIVGVVGSLLAAIGLWLAASMPVFGQDSGTVQVQVTVEAQSCLTLQTQTLNYGTLPLGGTGAGTLAISSCTPADQDLLASGTGGTGGASWSLVSTGTCGSGLQPNQFKHAISKLTGPPDHFLTSTPTSIGTLEGNASNAELLTTFVMPCAGSSGAGATINTSIVLTALIP